MAAYERTVTVPAKRISEAFAHVIGNSSEYDGSTVCENLFESEDMDYLRKRTPPGFFSETNPFRVRLVSVNGKARVHCQALRDTTMALGDFRASAQELRSALQHSYGNALRVEFRL